MVAANLFVEALGAHPVKGGEFGIWEHFMAAQNEDSALDVLDRYERFMAVVRRRPRLSFRSARRTASIWRRSGLPAAARYIGAPHGAPQ